MSKSNGRRRFSKALIFGLVAVIVVLGAALIVMAIGRAGTPTETEEVDVLANSDNECVVCHRKTTPGIVEQYGHSTMAAAEVGCQQCHEVEADYPGAVEHEGTYVLEFAATAMCEKCHAAEVAQFNQSRHGLPAYVAYAGTEDLSPEHLAMYEAIPEGSFCAGQIAQCHRRAGRPGHDAASPAKPATTSASPPRMDLGRPVPEMPPAARVQPGAGAQTGNLQLTATSVPITRSGRSTRNPRTELPT